MNEELELELEIVELGDAKEETRGLPNLPFPEESPQILFRQDD